MLNEDKSVQNFSGPPKPKRFADQVWVTRIFFRSGMGEGVTRSGMGGEGVTGSDQIPVDPKPTPLPSLYNSLNCILKTIQLPWKNRHMNHKRYLQNIV